MSSLVLINRQNLLSNLKVIRHLCPNSILAPCLKSNAYGHGLLQIATILENVKNSKNSSKNNLSENLGENLENMENMENNSNNSPIWFTLASFDEAEILRSNGIKSPILLVNSLQKSEIEKILEMENIRISLYSWQILQLAAQISFEKKKKLTIHLQIDTGMHWLGFETFEIVEIIEFVNKQEFLELEGIWTHFASSEDLENSYFDKQLADFLELKKLVIETFGNIVKLWHCANSGAILRDFKEKSEFNLVQPGKILYGSFVTGIMRQICKTKQIILKPVLSWETEIRQIKKLKKGDSIGYSQTFICQAEMEIAILPVGYFDGIPRNITSGFVLICGQKCPFVGRICMNLCMVKLPKNHNFEIGQTVILIGKSVEKTQNNKTENQEKIETKNSQNSKLINQNTNLVKDKSEIEIQNETENQTINEITLGLFAGWCGTIGREISVGINSSIERKIV